MWRRSSISSLRSALRAARYCGLSPGKRRRDRASSSAGFSGCVDGSAEGMDRLLVRDGGRDIALHPRRPALPNIDISDAEYFDSAEALDSGKHRPGVEFADPAPAKRCSIPMKPPSADERPRSRPSPVMLNVL